MIFKLCGAALLTAGAALILRQYKPEFALPVTVAGGIIMLLVIIGQLAPQIDFINELWYGEGFGDYAAPMVKSLGVALIAQTASDMCRDMGDTSTASKVEFAGKAEIMLLCLPLISELLGFARELLIG